MLNPILLTPGLRAQFSNKLRFFLVLLGVVLGSALCAFVLLINDMTIASLRQGVHDLAGETDLIVTTPGGDGFPETALETVQKVPGVASAVPVLQKKVFVILPNGEKQALDLLGIDLLNDSSVRARDEGRARLLRDPLAFMARPNSVALTSIFAARHGLKPEDPIEILTAFGAKPFVVRALIDVESVGKALGGSLIVMDIEAAKTVFGKDGKIDLINISVTDRSRVKEELAAVQSALGDGFSVAPPSSQVQSLRETIEPFQKMLSFLGLLAFGMAFFLIMNTARLSIAERRSEIGILRAIGAGRGLIFFALIAEYVVIGAVGSTGGAVLGWIAARLSMANVESSLASQTLTSFELQDEAMSLATPVLVAIAGTATTVAAVLGAVWKSATISPVDVIAQNKLEQIESGTVGRGRFAVLLIGTMAMIPLLFDFSGWKILHAGPLIGAVLLGPPLTVLVLRLSRWAGRDLRFPLLQLAWSYAVANRIRVEKSVRGLIVGLLLIFVVASVQNAFMDALANVFIRTARPDFYVSSGGDFMSPMTLQPLDDALQKDIAARPGISGVYGQRMITLKYESRQITMSAFDEVPPDTLTVPYSYFDVVDRPVAEAGHDLYHGEGRPILISESFASLFGKKTGDSISLSVLDRNLDFHVVGVVRDFSAGGGRLYLSRDRYKELWKDALVTGIAVVLAKGAELADVRADVEAHFAKSHGLSVTVDRGIKQDVEKILKKSFMTFAFIQWVCVFVAGLGFVSSFFIEIRNRSTELAVMRTVGVSKNELSAFLLTEAAVLGLGASVVSIVLALPLAWMLISRSLPDLLGWVVTFHADPVLCLFILLLGTGLAFIASLYSIKWARGLNPAEGLQGE